MLTYALDHGDFVHMLSNKYLLKFHQLHWDVSG